MAIVALVLTVLLRSAAAVLAKQAALTSPMGELVAFLRNPWYFAELACLGLQALTWVWALRHLPLAFAYPFLSLSFVLTFVASALLFGEVVMVRHVAGAVFVLLGVMIIATWRREAPRI